MDLPNIMFGFLTFVIMMVLAVFVHVNIITPFLDTVIDISTTDIALYYFLWMVVFIMELFVIVIVPTIHILKPSNNA